MIRMTRRVVGERHGSISRIWRFGLFGSLARICASPSSSALTSETPLVLNFFRELTAGVASKAFFLRWAIRLKDYLATQTISRLRLNPIIVIYPTNEHPLPLRLHWFLSLLPLPPL
jgi:hypothetical protein